MHSILFRRSTLTLNDFSAELAEYDCTVGRPNIKRWLDNVRHETQPVYDEAHSILWRIVEIGKAKRGGAKL